jgi:hypothetical protein
MAFDTTVRPVPIEMMMMITASTYGAYLAYNLQLYGARPNRVDQRQGEMSMVGPRPHAVVHNEMFQHQISGMSRRHNVKPGITGWAQVNGLRGETDTVEKMRKRVEYDLYYIINWSFIFAHCHDLFDGRVQKRLLGAWWVRT